MTQPSFTRGSFVGEATLVDARSLPLLLDELDAGPGEVAELRLGAIIGSGGMAVVREAKQLPLSRRVAVKIPHDSEVAIRALLDEAVVAGALAHPNIVPVHALGRDREGRPLLVMKLIEGRPWKRALRAPDRLASLTHHLGILTQVCHAVELAHDRGILHRDLKPENVMIGPFGEVYVVDWGLAVTLHDDGSSHLPLARDVCDVQGTAAYMAPEMLRAEGPRLGPRSDVYLLGGMLHAVLTGVAPFRGLTYQERAENPEAEPQIPIPEELPAELVAVCRHALASEPAARFPSAGAFRVALEEALQHLTSTELAAAARTRLVRLQVALDDEADPRTIRDLVVEARFGYRQALDAWPESEEARAGLQRTLALACAHEVKRENHAAALALLTAMPQPDPELAAQVAALDATLTSRRAEVRALEELEQNVDPSVDAAKRSRAGAVLGGLLLLGFVLAQAIAPAARGGRFAVALGLLIAISAAAALLHARWFAETNVVNLRLHRAVQIALAAGAIMLLFGWWGGLALGDAVTVIMVGMAGMLTATSIALSLRLRVASVSAFVAVAALLLPGPRALWLFLALVAVVVAVVKGLRRLVREVADEASPEEPVGPGVPPPLSSLPERRDTPPPPHEEAATWRESHGPRGTELMVEERRTEGPVVERPPWVEVSELPVIHTAGAGSRLRLEGEMGRGGMGKVHAGLEIPLRRRVAVKTAAPEGSPAATAALLREAYVAGLLDHPNVVPVHVLGRDDRGQPLLVMKYVEGTRWSTALASPDRFARLDHHLGIFMQVCHAIDYAHHRGIVHRDIKASNVMVGAFGEVQVLDWGLAAALGDEHRGVLPLTSDIAVPEGTAAYMAPEMVRAEGGAIGVATDVYLLGGLLHFLLTGAPPHAGCSLADRVADPSQVVRVVAPRAPRELAAICARALDPNPRARYGSAAAMREAVASYLEHRASLELTVSALSRVSALAELLASPDPPPGEVNALSLEARFGFREALRIWPDNHRARAGLQRVLELACRYAIERGDEEAGRALYLALPEPNPVLEQRLDDLARERRERDARVRELEALRQGVDLAVDKRSRMWGAVVLGGLVVVAVAGLTAARLLGLHEAGYVDAVVIVALTTILNGYLQLSQRSRTNEANVRLHRFLVTCLFAATVHLLACWRLGVGFTFGLALLMLLFAVMAFLSAALMSWLVVPTGACFLLAASALMIWPELRPLLLIAGFGLAFGSLAVAARFIESATWWPEPRAKAGSRPPC